MLHGAVYCIRRSLVLLSSTAYEYYAPMNSTAFETKDITKAHGGPLRILHAAIAALVVARQGLDDRLIGGCHLNHD